MPWENARHPRAKRLPSDWSRLRAKILARDKRICGICGREGATEVDHIRRGDNHDPGNLQAAHSVCHRAKTAAESGHASGAARRARAMARFRPEEPHPGLKRNQP